MTPEPEFVEELVAHVGYAVPESMVCGLRSHLMQYRDVFSESEYDLGRTSVVTHRIETEGARPVRQQLRRYPPAHLEAISKHVDNVLQQGAIEPAASPWASNIVLVRKKITATVVVSTTGVSTTSLSKIGIRFRALTAVWKP